MGIDDKADNKAEELKGKGRKAIGDSPGDKDLQAQRPSPGGDGQS
jgi:uncharacterized protein YjbJ (UPF0337 family)